MPLSFAPVARQLSDQERGLHRAMGSPMLLRAMNQWRAVSLLGSESDDHHLQRRDHRTSGRRGLAARPWRHRADDRPGPVKLAESTRTRTLRSPYRRCPSPTGWITRSTGQPVRNLKLNQRLLAKLLTQSYNFRQLGCGQASRRRESAATARSTATRSTSSPIREFQRLNPKVRHPVGFGGGVPGSDRRVRSQRHDLGSDQVDREQPRRRRLHEGQFDQWGMHVNTNYLGLKYPIDSFTGQDSYPIIAHKYSPRLPAQPGGQLPGAELGSRNSLGEGPVR